MDFYAAYLKQDKSQLRPLLKKAAEIWPKVK